MKQPAP